VHHSYTALVSWGLGVNCLEGEKMEGLDGEEIEGLEGGGDPVFWTHP